MTVKYMDRSTTGALKGIALILMFIHHMFAFPEFLIDGIVYPGIQTFADLFCMPTEICVSIFAFLTGYFYAFAKQRTLRYSLRKITDLYISYWVVYLVLLMFALVTGCCEFSLYIFAHEMTAAKTEIMVFCWYVVFYSCAMLLLPVLTFSKNRTLPEDTFVLLILPVVVSSILSKMELGGIWYNISLYILEWFPCVAVGYLFAKYDLFEKLFDRRIQVLPRQSSRVFVWASMVLFAFTGRYWCNYLHLGELVIRGGAYKLIFKTDILYTPMFIYGAANLLQYLKKHGAIRILEKIGQYSLLMWFIHCAFYNVCRDLLQPILYAPGNPILVILWGLLLSFIPAVLLDPVIRLLQKWKNKIL